MTETDTSVTYLKLTELNATLIHDVLDFAIRVCEEEKYECWTKAPESKVTATTATLSLDMWERVAEDCEMVAGDYMTGDRSVGHSTTSEMSDGFIESADARLSASWVKQATKIQRAVDQSLAAGGRFLDGTNEPTNR